MKEKIRILFIEDKIADYELAQNELKKANLSFDSICADNREGYLNALNSFNADIIISDYLLPDFDGLSAIKLKKEICPEIPIIILTGSIDEYTAVECIKEGAFDYVLKDFLVRLPNAVISALEMAKIQTEKRQSQLALEKSEERFRISFENSAIAKTITTLDGKIIKLNNAFCEMLGYREDELTNSSILAVTHPDDVERSWEFAHSLTNGNEKVSHYQKRYISKMGKVIWADVSLILHKDSLGNPVYFSSDIQDFTAKKEAEKQLKILSIAVEQNPVSVMITDVHGKIEYVNPKFVSTTGYTTDEVIGKSPNILKSGHTPANIFKELWEKIITGEEWHGEFQNKKKNGETFLDYSVISSIKDDSGKITHFVSVQEDVTQQRKSQIEIASSEVQFRSVWENSFDGMRLCDGNGIIIKVNNAFCKLIDKPKNEIEGKYFNVCYLNEGNKERGINKFQTSFRNRTVESKLEAPITLWNNKKIWVELSNSYIELEGKTAMLLSVFRDITDRKESEIKLREAKEKADEMNRIKSSFLANMSHELRTPLIGILGFSEILKQEIMDKEKLEMVDTIHRGGQRLLSTLNLILDLSRIEAGKLDIRYKQLDVVSTIRETVKVFETLLAKKELYIKLNFEEEKIYASLDERILREIIDNLVNNAIKYTDNGGLVISAKKISVDDNPFVCIEFEDTGIGIAPEKLEIIFDEFRQASEGYNRSFEGVGLGLTITKRFVEALNGSISVKSSFGKGTTFTVILPANKNELKNVENTTGLVQGNEAEKDNHDYVIPDILIVDDDKPTRDVLKFMLRNEARIDFTDNGIDAVQKAKNKKYDIILMDINLGAGFSGLDAVQEIRKLKEYKDTPILALTAYAMVGDKEKFMSAGCTHYLSKPFSKEQIKRTIRTVQKINKPY